MLVAGVGVSHRVYYWKRLAIGLVGEISKDAEIGSCFRK